MASTVTPTVTSPDGKNEKVRYATWDLTGKTVIATDEILPVELPAHADRSVQLLGTFGGSTVVVEGSNVDQPVTTTASDWTTLSDPQGNALSFTAAGIKQVLEVTKWIRVRVSAGTSTSVIARMAARQI